MRTELTRFTLRAAAAASAALALASTPPIQAQTRVTLPTGSVLLVRTGQALESASMKVGQTFETSVLEPVSVNGYVLIPGNSQIRGVVAYVQPASRERSGVMQVNFDRLTLPGGTVYQIAGKLTSTDSTERRQIESRADSRVVLVGERGGLGAAIAGAGSTKSASSGILAALGNMLSEGRDVAVPAGTTFAVQLERALTLTGRGAVNATDESTIFTAVDRIRAAQQALARKSYYRGAANGQIDNATRTALFEFQLDNNITPTGNLDGRTAAALGITSAGSGTESTNGPILTAQDASILRRAAQALAGRQRTDLGMTTAGKVDINRDFAESDLDLLFAFSAFADNASLYEQFVRTAANPDATALAGRALVNTARRVDTAFQQAQTSTQIQNVWQSIRRQLAAIDPSYR